MFPGLGRAAGCLAAQILSGISPARMHPGALGDLPAPTRVGLDNRSDLVRLRSSLPRLRDREGLLCGDGFNDLWDRFWPRPSLHGLGE